MSLEDLLTETITITPRNQASATEDEYGNPILETPGSVDYLGRLEVVGGAGLPASSEDLSFGDYVDTDARAFLPSTALIGHLDRVEHYTGLYEVVGDPTPQATPEGVHHIQVILRRVTGG